MTIEMTLLMPIIVSVILLIMYGGFYIHDKCEIEQYLFRNINRFRTNSEETKLTDQVDIYGRQNDITDASDMYSMLIGKWDTDIETVVNEDRITVYVKGDMKLSDGLMSKYFLNDIFTLNTEVSIFNVSGERYVREEYEYSD